MEAKVPQRIDMEDRIIGPLTLTQFFYLLFGGLFIYLLNSWTIGSPLRILFYLGAIIIGAASLAFAFLKIQDRPFAVFVSNVFSYMSKPRQRIWHKSNRARKTIIIPDKLVAQAEAPHKELDRNKLVDLAKLADSAQPSATSTEPKSASFWNKDNTPNT